MADIDNTIRIYLKSSKETKKRRYTSYACIYVYLNIAKPLPGSVALEYHDEDWSQTIYYKKISLICRKFLEHEHLFRDYPLNATTKNDNLETIKEKYGFTQVGGRRCHIVDFNLVQDLLQTHIQ
jgi:hypothetical protein